MIREHSWHSCRPISRASPVCREDEPDAIGLDASLRHPGCSNGGRGKDSTERSLHARLTLIRSCARYVRIIVTSGIVDAPDAHVGGLPPSVVYGRPITFHSPVASVMRSPI